MSDEPDLAGPEAERAWLYARPGPWGHITPDRVLRSIEAKRKILAAVTARSHVYNDDDPWFSAPRPSSARWLPCRGAGNNGPVSTATASSFLNAGWHDGALLPAPRDPEGPGVRGVGATRGSATGWRRAARPGAMGR